MSTLHWVALATSARVGAKTLTNLLTHFGTLDAVFEASSDALRKVPLVGPKTAAAIQAVDLEAIQTDLLEIESSGIQVLTWQHPDYPHNLLHCNDAPPVLFVCGSLDADDQRAVAIVGTRQPRPDSRRLAQEMAYELAKRSWWIVSGLALGIDTAAHHGALDANGRTVAVLGCGLKTIYPTQNADLAVRISESGALLSEVHPKTVVSPQQLIARNRIQSGLSRGVIVVETGLNGGSVSTARRATEQRRRLFAVVGGDEGCNALLEDGAIPIEPSTVDWDELSAQLEEVVL